MLPPQGWPYGGLRLERGWVLKVGFPLPQRMNDVGNKTNLRLASMLSAS